MKRIMTAFLFLMAGLVAGGLAVWLFVSPALQKEAAPQKASEAKTERKILYYRNPMDPSVTSPVPMKDQMGMDYIPVYEDETQVAEAPGAVRITPERIQKIGVKSEPVERRGLIHVIRTVGRVEPVEDRVNVITAKVTGWIERLYVNRTDQMVSQGERLLELYSPELVSAQQEYLLALEGKRKVQGSPYPEAREGAESLLRAARQRLEYWDISDDQIRALEARGEVSRTLAIRSPATGSVTEKMVVEGQKIEAGEPLFKIIDHSRVWVYGEIYEYEMPYIKKGQTAALTPAYSPGEIYTGKIEHIYSHLGSIRYTPEEGTEVRTAKVRVALPNKDHKLKLGMYLNVEISVPVARNSPVVPDSAVIDTGERQLVIIDRRDGTFEPREVRLGARGDGMYEIKAGVSEGEWVVTSANFLVDSESSLKAAVSAMTGSGKAAEAPAPAEQPAGGHVH